MVKIDHTQPKGKWVFDDEVTHVFDDMLERSIPQYQTMRHLVFQMGARYVQPHTDIVDLGCSRGEALARMVQAYKKKNKYIGVEVSPPMIKACRQRFRELTDYVSILDMDLRTEYPQCQASVTLSVLTLMFTPMEYRLEILSKIYDHLIPGGALILVEKLLGNSAQLNRHMIDTYYEHKQSHGYSLDDIERKRLSLEGVLVPMTAHWNEEMLQQTGFKQVDCFWRWCNFGGWVAVK